MYQFMLKLKDHDHFCNLTLLLKSGKVKGGVTAQC